MEHLILKSGRYVPHLGAHGAVADTEERVRSLEDHMSRLTEELEHLLELLDEAIARFEDGEHTAVATAESPDEGEEEAYEA